MNTATTEPGTGWHFEYNTGIRTRHPLPDVARPTTRYRILGLDDDQLRRDIAVHEAGHATLLLFWGIPFEFVEIAADLGKGSGSGGRVAISGTAPFEHVIVELAAGERAEDRWMREVGLWSPQRAFAVEIGACGDRRAIDTAVRTVHGTGLTYGTSTDWTRDLAALHQRADEAVDAVWDRVLTLAEALERNGRLTHEQAAEAAGFTPVGIGGAR
ncbi:hypothetical protein [Kitasatospora sp. NPDC101183]|uniref:hypothetical protein n=1 Tax=Kitasatospora sp. NPDC101183 TaxID=3364100 RepID=UPI0038194B52